MGVGALLKVQGELDGARRVWLGAARLLLLALPHRVVEHPLQDRDGRREGDQDEGEAGEPGAFGLLDPGELPGADVQLVEDLAGEWQMGERIGIRLLGTVVVHEDLLPLGRLSGRSIRLFGSFVQIKLIYFG